MPSKTVAVIGASYGGTRVAHLLAQDLPQGWRVVVIDRNSHMNHLYVLPRYAVLPGHEHKAFIPYKNIFHPLPPPALDTPSASPAPPSSPPPTSPHVFLHAAVTSISHHSLVLDKAYPEHGVSELDRTLHFDFLIYALGSHLPAPINLWGPVADEDLENADVLDVSRGTKEGGVDWLKRFQKRIARASSVLVVGGGALGIRECPPSNPYLRCRASLPTILFHLHCVRAPSATSCFALTSPAVYHRTERGCGDTCIALDIPFTLVDVFTCYSNRYTVQVWFVC